MRKLFNEYLDFYQNNKGRIYEGYNKIFGRVLTKEELKELDEIMLYGFGVRERRQK